MKRTPGGVSESLIALYELLNLKENGQFPGESVKTEGTQIHNVAVRTSNVWYKDDNMRGTIIIISVVLVYFVIIRLI